MKNKASSLFYYLWPNQPYKVCTFSWVSVCVCVCMYRHATHLRVNKSTVELIGQKKNLKKIVEAEIKCAKWLQNKMKPQWDEAK